MPIDIVYGTPATDKYDGPSDFVNDLHLRLEEAYTAVRVNCGVAAERRRKKYFRSVRDPQFAVGDRVWYYVPRRRPLRYYKWESLYTGPFEIVALTGPVNFRIRPASGRGAEQVVHADKLKKSRAWVEDELSDTVPPVASQSAVGGPTELRQTRPKRRTTKPARFG